MFLHSVPRFSSRASSKAGGLRRQQLDTPPGSGVPGYKFLDNINPPRGATATGMRASARLVPAAGPARSSGVKATITFCHRESTQGPF